MLDQGIVALILFFLFSLSIGSFLGLLVHRLPKILEENSRTNIHLLNLMFQRKSDFVSLTFPSSQCDLCANPIPFSENIPLLSFLFLGGKCAKCKRPISKLYPAIELVTLLCSFSVLYKLGLASTLLPLLGLTWTLIALSFIDLTNKFLPDQLTIPLIWAGLLTNVLFEITPLPEAILGAVFGYLSLWILFWLYKLLRSKEALGYGDFKLLSAMGAWFGITALSPILLISALSGLVFSVYRFVSKGSSLKEPIPFGPFLSLGAFTFFIFEEQIASSLASLL